MRELFLEDTIRSILLSIIESWGSRSFQQQAPFAVQLSITSCILVLFGGLSESYKVDVFSASQMLNAGGSFLESSFPDIRELGMIAFETMSRAVHPKELQLNFKLDFNLPYELRLRALVNLPRLGFLTDLQKSPNSTA